MEKQAGGKRERKPTLIQGIKRAIFLSLHTGSKESPLHRLTPELNDQADTPRGGACLGLSSPGKRRVEEDKRTKKKKERRIRRKKDE